jgi:hypothetical protein
MKCAPDRFKMPQSDSIHVQPVPNKKNGNLVFILTSFLTSSKATFVYLVEIPPSLNLDKLAITFLGRSSVLSRPPLLLSEGTFIAISEVEATEVFQITEEKNNNVERPFLKTIHVFENFGIIQQLDFNKEKKSMLVNSFKLKNNLQSFQKGLLLDSINNFKLETKAIREIRFVTIEEQLSMVVFLKDKALVYHFGATCNIYPEKTLQFAVPLILFNRLAQNLLFVVSHSFIAVYSVWENSKEVLRVDFDGDSNNMITSADSIGDVLAYSDKSSLTIMRFSGQRLTLIKEISPEEEIKQVKSLGDKFFLVYWFATHIDVISTSGVAEARVELGTAGVHSFHTYQESSGDRVFLVGTNYGTILHKVFGSDMREKYSQEILVGKKPVKVREASANKVFAVSDESSLLSFPPGTCNVEISPLCHSELVDIFTFTYQANDFYLLVNSDSMGFGLVNNSTADNYRMKNIRLEGVATIDRFVSVEDYYISAYSDPDDKACEVVVSSASSGAKVSRQVVPVGRAECMIKLRFMENWYVLIGFSLPEGPETGDFNFGELSEGMVGKLKCYLLRNGELLEIIEQDFEKPVRMMNLLENGTNLLLTIGYSQLRVLKLEPKLRKLNDKSIEVTAPSLKEVHQQKFSFLIDSASVSDNFILLTDFYWVAHMLLFESIRYPRFKPIGRMTTNLNEIISAEITPKQKFIVSDRSDNLLVFGLKEKGSSDIDFTEFSAICGICLGEKVLCYRKGQKANNLQFGDGGLQELNAWAACRTRCSEAVPGDLHPVRDPAEGPQPARGPAGPGAQRAGVRGHRAEAQGLPKGRTQEQEDELRHRYRRRRHPHRPRPHARQQGRRAAQTHAPSKQTLAQRVPQPLTIFRRKPH